jgi:hypothetical protein
MDNNLLTINQASIWASDYLGKEVTPSNISYLIQYGRIRKIGDNGTTQIALSDLMDYYRTYNQTRERYFKQQLGEDLNWELSFDKHKEKETTKHVHRLHPYKGKFIPQLVEYFLDNHTDKFKKDTYFNKGDIVLDPFCGSGTTMIQACELGINAVGIDVSKFNTLISNCKVKKYDIASLDREIKRITNALLNFVQQSDIIDFENKLLEELNLFNYKYFPVPDYKYRVRNKQINEKEYGKAKEQEFLPVFEKLVKEYNIKLLHKDNSSFLNKWYLEQIRNEIYFVYEQINQVVDSDIRDILNVILSRTVRSCRATTHADLATLLEPVTATYYCSKHGKICKPLFSILKWWKTYSKDTVQRLQEFDKLRTDTFQLCLTGDSRTLDIVSEVKKVNKSLGDLMERNKIKGIFSSPPYVGLIDYHEQHAYAYDLFGFERKDGLEIGAMAKGQTKEAQQDYVKGISDVLNNCKKYLAEDYDVFLVANDKYNLYTTIAEQAEMQIVNQFKRPVLNRTEKDKGAYSETIFHLKERKYII